MSNGIPLHHNYQNQLKPEGQEIMIEISFNGILFILTTGCRWADMPDKYGSKSTAHLRFQELQQKGIWKKILSKLIKLAHKQGKINLQKISIDSSSIAAKKGAMR